ncbi:MAG: phosphoribosylformylglycinamidine synthase subunit PurQ, partial [Pseudobutyrivibrio sp.]|nr:phosphoribosylformylglycinamidine synthase subunit PurQ [Pseudobutyrivibrio sp.]
DVPPTLVSFAVDVAKQQDIVTPELKNAGDKLVLLHTLQDGYEQPNYGQVKAIYETIHQMVKTGMIKAAYALDANGLVPAVSKMAFGNKMGVKLLDTVTTKTLFGYGVGDIVIEVTDDGSEAVEREMAKAGIADCGSLVGYVTDDGRFSYKDVSISVEEAIAAWTLTLEKVFKTKSQDGAEKVDSPLYEEKNIYVCKNKIAKPRVFIPVFPGTNCEYDSARVFEEAGAITNVKVFKNQSPEDIRESVDEFTRAIAQSQIVMFPGGFSAGDEPEGSAKFFATAFRNEKMKEAVSKLLNERDGLMLGICNGFQALIKLGLVPYGEIHTQKEDSPTLTYNTIGRHISKIAYTKIVSNKSPWLAGAELGHTYCAPASHGEGRFVANDQWIKKLWENGQVATQYVDIDGNASMDEEWNINGSYCAIEGITSPDGRVFGKMCHAERQGSGVALNIYGDQDMKIFESGVNYFR